jgi:hypothetical protein
MGVDYDGVGGIGVEFTDEMRHNAIERGIFSEEEWEDCSDDCMNAVGISYSTAGSAYSGEETHYLMVDGDTLGEVNANSGDFCSSVNDRLGTKLVPAELRVIADLHIW